MSAERRVVLALLARAWALRSSALKEPASPPLALLSGFLSGLFLAPGLISLLFLLRNSMKLVPKSRQPKSRDGKFEIVDIEAKVKE